ncbi:hypothetical protein KJ903_05310 [Patescibacteria group bacterium]|nr:hypothetical protein [Patescibacteria group bacterium]
MNAKFKKFAKTRKYLAEIGRLVFWAYGLTYFLFYFIDQIKKGFISDFLSLNIILIIFVIGGVLYLLKLHPHP